MQRDIAGFLRKEATSEEFLRTTKSVIAGKKVLPVKLTGSLFVQIVDDAIKNGRIHPTDMRMTQREREVVDLIAEGPGVRCTFKGARGR